MAKRRNFFLPDEPLCNPGHHRPRTRRELIAQGFALGTGTVIAGSMLSLFPERARAALSADLQAQLNAGGLCASGSGGGTGMVPFVCFDLAGGANFAGSNVLIGGRGGQRDFLSTAGYSVLGLPSAMLPSSSTTNFIDNSCGIAFHSLSAMLAGIKETATAGAMAGTHGSIVAARSENDTGNNPHNPMYGIYRAGARGSLVNLIGSQNSDSGGNSMAPAMLIDVSARPTKVDRPSDVTGLVGTSSTYTPPLAQSDTVAAMESMKRISDNGLDRAATQYSITATPRDAVKCEILKSVDNTDKFGATSPDPTLDPVIAGGTAGSSTFTSIFPGGVNSSGEFLKTASIMKLVVGTDNSSKHYAAAGTITMGGYDYHTGDRTTGEMRDRRAGQCIGAVLEYAHRIQQPVMIYVFSDGSLSSSGMIDNNVAAQGKSVWTSDNQGTGSAFFLVYRPGGTRPTPVTATGLVDTAGQPIGGPQIGWFKMDGTVDTTSSPAANSVVQLVDTVVLNYLSLHSNLGAPLDTVLAAALNKPATSILGGSANWSRYVAFQPIV